MFGDHLRSTNSSSAVLQCDLPWIIISKPSNKRHIENFYQKMTSDMSEDVPR